MFCAHSLYIYLEKSIIQTTQWNKNNNVHNIKRARVSSQYKSIVNRFIGCQRVFVVSCLYIIFTVLKCMNNDGYSYSNIPESPRGMSSHVCSAFFNRRIKRKKEIPAKRKLLLMSIQAKINNNLSHCIFSLTSIYITTRNICVYE